MNNFILFKDSHGAVMGLIHFWSKWLRHYVDVHRMNLQLLDVFV